MCINEQRNNCMSLILLYDLIVILFCYIRFYWEIKQYTFPVIQICYARVARRKGGKQLFFMRKY